MASDRPNPTRRQRQIICGLFLSKFDTAALEYLGFEGFSEAFNALGWGLRAKPASIKNYRDEFDPYFPNRRKGWHKRPLREHCRSVMEEYNKASVAELGETIKGFLCPDEELQRLPNVLRVLGRHGETGESSFAKRLITGKAAEEYFVANYGSMPEFSGLVLTETTGWGCGFDFKLADRSSDMYSAVEVKGLRQKVGQVQMTDLEHAMAEALADRYYMVLVRNFAEQPFHSVFRDPLRCGLEFERVERKEVRVSWVVDVLT